MGNNERLFMIGRVERDGAELSKPLNWREIADRAKPWLDHEERDYHIKQRGETFGTVRNGPKTWRRLHEVVPNSAIGTTWIVENVATKAKFIIRVVAAMDNKPTKIELGATDGVELIAGETWERFNDDYGLINMGTYANKPGEHGLHPPNAIDIGVRKPNDADAIHRALVVIAEWQRSASQDRDHPLFDRVNGIIRMYSICKYEGPGNMTSWYPYSGVPHVSHVHDSARPNPLPGWI